MRGVISLPVPVAAVKTGLTGVVLIKNYSLNFGASILGSLVTAYEPFSFSAGLRAGYFEDDWYFTPAVEPS